jgi:hypothetical protein
LVSVNWDSLFLTDDIELLTNEITNAIRAAKIIIGPRDIRNLGPHPPILQIMTLNLSSPRCVISKESVQQQWIDELWFRTQLSTCLVVLILKEQTLYKILSSLAFHRCWFIIFHCSIARISKANAKWQFSL